MTLNAARTASSTTNSRVLVALGVFLWFSAQATVAHTQIALPSPERRVVLRGVVFDSLIMKPLGNATVWIPGGTQTTRSDAEGRFELDDVPTGMQFIAFSTPALDSLGMGTLGGRVDVSANNARAGLFTPSFNTVWRALCSQAVSATRDSGIVWGTVRDANTDTRLNGASMGFSWYDMSITNNSKIDFRELTHQVRTDSTGTYYACGLPGSIKLSSEATGTKSASGTIEYVIGDRRLVRVDLLVSTDMVLQKPLNDATVAEMSPRGTASLRGHVVDAKGKDVVGASITVASLDTVVRTNALGEFTILNLPAGTHGLQARSVGYSPATMLVELRPKQVTRVTLPLPDARMLATVNVRADRAQGPDQLEFLQRHKTGMGYVLTANQLRGLTDVGAVLQSMVGMQVNRSRGQASATMSDRKGGRCVPAFFIDKLPASADEISMYKPDNFVAVEVYNSQFTVPVTVPNGSCGAVMFWTKTNPRW